MKKQQTIESEKVLQQKMEQFLLNSRLNLNGVIIVPKEIEAYYYEDGKFEEDSVHKNELQRNNKNHFYIHRNGLSRYDAYKGGRRPGIDFVLSDNSNIYFSFLIRSAVVDGRFIVGPNKVLNEIRWDSRLSNEDIEKHEVIIEPCKNEATVLFSERIGLGKGVANDFLHADLRAVVCDENYRRANYAKKEKMIVDHLVTSYGNHNLSKDEAINYVRLYLGYVPKAVRTM